MSETAYSIGIDLGGTHIKGVLVQENGEMLLHQTRPTEDGLHPSGAKWKQSIAEMIAYLREKSPAPPSAVGLAAPGIALADHTGIHTMPGRLEGLEQFDWCDYLKQEITVLNDAHAALVAEHKWGHGTSVQDLMLLTLGTGVGGGVLLNGQLLRGKDMRAGHLGHVSLLTSSDTPGISGMPGSLEYAMGEYSLPKRSFGRYQSTRELVEAYQAGNAFATYVWLNSIRQTAIAICSLINAFSPQQVLLGGGITQAGRHLFEPLQEMVDLFEWRPQGRGVPIQAAKFLKWSGAYGAAAAALFRESYLGR